MGFFFYISVFISKICLQIEFKTFQSLEICFDLKRNLSADLRKSVCLACVKENTFCKTGFPPHVTFLRESPRHCQQIAMYIFNCSNTLLHFWWLRKKEDIFSISIVVSLSSLSAATSHS